MRATDPVPVRASESLILSIVVSLLLVVPTGCGSDGEDVSSWTPGPRPVSDERPVLAASGDVEVDRGSTFAAVSDSGEGELVVIFTNADGWAYLDDEGYLTGVSVEILEDFFRWVESTRDVSLDVVWSEDDDWMQFYRRVRDARGGVIGAGNVTITDERRQELDFSPAYQSNVAVLITHEAVPELESMQSASERFRGFAAHPYLGTLHEERVNQLRERRIPGLRVLPLNSNDEILAAVSGSPDRLAWIDAHAYFRGVEEGLPIRRHPVADDSSESFGFILPRGSDWTPLLEEFFLEGDGYRNSERYREILLTHLGEGLSELLEDVREAREDRLDGS